MLNMILKAKTYSFGNLPLQEGQSIIYEERGIYYPSKQSLE